MTCNNTKDYRWFRIDGNGTPDRTLLVDMLADVALFAYLDEGLEMGPVMVDPDSKSWVADDEKMAELVKAGEVRFYRSFQKAFENEGGCPFSADDIVGCDSNMCDLFSEASNQVLKNMESYFSDKLPNDWENMDQDCKEGWMIFYFYEEWLSEIESCVSKHIECSGELAERKFEAAGWYLLNYCPDWLSD